MSTTTVSAMDGAASAAQAGMPAVGDVLVISAPGCKAAALVGSRLAARGRGGVTGCAMPHDFLHGRTRGPEPTVMALLATPPGQQREEDLSEGHTGDAFCKEARRMGVGDAQWAVLGSDYLGGFKRLCSWHDLVVVQRPADEDANPIAGFDALMMGSGLPVLVLPTPCAPGATHECIALAWDGSPPATRALRAALPFAIAARQVCLLDGSPAHPHQPAFDPVAFLGRYGVTVVHKHVATGPLDGTQLLSRAHRIHADLLVMGAYGHSPLRERVFGGTTRSVLASARIAVLLHH